MIINQKQISTGSVTIKYLEKVNKMKPIHLKEKVFCDPYNHWMQFDKNHSRSRCKMTNCKYSTHVTCSKCEIHLCFSRQRNCFTTFHLSLLGKIESQRQSVTVNYIESTSNKEKGESTRHNKRYKSTKSHKCGPTEKIDKTENVRSLRDDKNTLKKRSAIRNRSDLSYQIVNVGSIESTKSQSSENSHVKWKRKMCLQFAQD